MIFDVTYAVTRTEVYRVVADNAAEAEAVAFDEGLLVSDTGETTGVDTLAVTPARR